MSISKATFETLQSLAALELDESDGQRLRHHLDVMVTWLAELPAAASPSSPGVSPPEVDAWVAGGALRPANESLRDDRVRDSLPVSALLRNTPDKHDDFYRVPPGRDRDR